MMNKKGFTLVELMVVIVIIGVLAAVAIPKFSAATNKAKASEMPSVMSQIMSAQDVYITETNDYAGDANNGGANLAGGKSQGTTLKSVLGVDANGSRYFNYTVNATNTAALSTTYSTVVADIEVPFGETVKDQAYTLRQAADGVVAKATANNGTIAGYVRSFDAQYTTTY